MEGVIPKKRRYSLVEVFLGLVNATFKHSNTGMGTLLGDVSSEILNR